MRFCLHRRVLNKTDCKVRNLYIKTTGLWFFFFIIIIQKKKQNKIHNFWLKHRAFIQNKIKYIKIAA